MGGGRGGVADRGRREGKFTACAAVALGGGGVWVIPFRGPSIFRFGTNPLGFVGADVQNHRR